MKRVSPFFCLLKFRKLPPVPEGGQLSITAGGMTEGHETCGQASGGKKRPRRGRTISSLAPVRPLRGRLESVSVIRRFHSLRSFHLRLFTFAPFGDGRMLLAKVQYNIKRKHKKRVCHKPMTHPFLLRIFFTSQDSYDSYFTKIF